MSKSLNINAPQIVQTRNTLNAVPSGSTATPDENVKYVPQTLTDAQQAQARQNIGAISATDIPAQVQSDWNETDTASPAYIQNKPESLGGNAAELDKYWTVKITAATTMTITGTVNNVWQNGTALTPVNGQYSLSANSVIRIDADNIQLEFADTTSTEIYVWVPKNVTLTANPLPSNSNATLMYAAAGTETFTTQATVVILNNKFWVNAIDCRKLVLIDASKADLSNSKHIEWFVDYAQILVSVNDLDAFMRIVDQYGSYMYTLGRTTSTYDGYLYVDYTLKTVKFSAMPLRLLEDTRFAIIVYSDVTSTIYIDGIDYVFNNGECTYNAYAGNTGTKQIVPGKNVITFSSDTSGEDVHHRIEIADKTGNYTVIRKYSRGYTGALVLDGDNYTGKINIIGGLNNNLHQEGGEGWEFPTGSDVNYYNMCNHWAIDGELYGNMIMVDTDFPTPSHTASAIPTTTNLNAIYVPKSRKAAFITYLTTLYDGLDITPMTNKIVEYDFLNWMDDHTPQVIILPTVPLTMTDANGNTIDGDFVAQNITITPAV